MSADERPATPPGLARDLDPETRSSPLETRRWTILRIMIVIAVLAPLFALLRVPGASEALSTLSRWPVLLGLGVTIGPITWLLVDSFRRRRYGRIAWLMCAYPVLPLLAFYLQWGLITRKVIRKSTVTVLDGVIAFSDIGGYLCLMAYVACVACVAAGRARDFPGLKRAAWRVILIMPFSWVALIIFTLWDPFGMLGYYFH